MGKDKKTKNMKLNPMWEAENKSGENKEVEENLENPENGDNRKEATGMTNLCTLLKIPPQKC